MEVFGQRGDRPRRVGKSTTSSRPHWYNLPKLGRQRPLAGNQSRHENHRASPFGGARLAGPCGDRFGARWSRMDSGVSAATNGEMTTGPGPFKIGGTEPSPNAKGLNLWLIDRSRVSSRPRFSPGCRRPVLQPATSLNGVSGSRGTWFLRRPVWRTVSIRPAA